MLLIDHPLGVLFIEHLYKSAEADGVHWSAYF